MNANFQTDAHLYVLLFHFIYLSGFSSPTERNSNGNGLGFCSSIWKAFPGCCEINLGNVLFVIPTKSSSTLEFFLKIYFSIVKNYTHFIIQLKNKRPPIGKCGQRQLKHFNEYSWFRCQRYCEIEQLKSDCGCKAVYMVSGEKGLCKINNQVNCGNGVSTNIW